MLSLKYICFLLCLFILCHITIGDLSFKESTVVIAILARNKAHTLPYFLSLLENLNYPKDRIALWIRSDHSIDDTNKILSIWIDSIKDKYHLVNFELNDNEDKFEEETGPAHWSKARFSHVIKLREEALNYARNLWADYILQFDCDVLLTNPNTLTEMISKDHPIVAPMLKSDSLYSNFWSGMTSEYYYLRTDDYKPILNKERSGCFIVPMVHSCVLIDLRIQNSDLLTYDPKNLDDYDGPHDDIITFALSANQSDISMHICNEDRYGYVTVPLEQNDSLYRDYQQLINIKLETIADGQGPINILPILKQFISVPEKDKLGFDAIYMINLKRRPERRLRMEACFDELGLDAETVDAVDGKALNESVLASIHLMEDYADPYHGRSMTFGEIGCFLSHYEVWMRVLAAGHKRVLVLEDDIRFEPYFRAKVHRLHDELNKVGEWDLVYLGRKRLQDQDEPFVEGSQMLIHVGYSYWTLGYALTYEGAKKLYEAKPLENLLPVDEYLPIMFNRHPQETWTQHYPERNLVAMSVTPLLMFPTHYTGETGYISDTEDSAPVTDPPGHDGEL